jgi:hypothetical protein
MAANAQTTRTVEIKMHKETVDRSSGLRIKFVGLAEDSRCPTDTDCIWAGNARISIRVSGKRMAARTLTLNSTTNPKVVAYGGYKFRLVDLTPHPRSNIRIDPNGYQATIEVTRQR